MLMKIKSNIIECRFPLCNTNYPALHKATEKSASTKETNKRRIMENVENKVLIIIK